MNTSLPTAEVDENPERPISIGTATEQLLGGGTLSYELTCQVFESMMTGRVDHAEIGALLGILATRVPTGNEIAGAAAIMRKHVRLVDTSVDRNSLLDTAGTGGAPKTFNVSTAAAIVAAAGGPMWPNMATSLEQDEDQRSFCRALGSTSKLHWKFRPDALMSLGSVFVLPQTTILPPNMSCRFERLLAFQPSLTCWVLSQTQSKQDDN